MQTLLKLFLMAIISPAVMGHGAGSNRVPYSITISTPETTVKAGSQVKITIIIKNVTVQRLPVNRANGKDQGEFLNDLEIRDEHGQQAKEKNALKILRGEPDEHGHSLGAAVWSEGTFYLDPGQTLEDTIIANKLYDLTPGRYSIQVSRYEPGYSRRGFSKTRVKSNIITLTVTP